jgi:Zn-dependent peptidase ImmA (M78 family)/DNA-binding XRE family transcriptional regulator
MLSSIDPVVFGQRLTEARKARGKTQEEAAAIVGCSRPTYIAIEKGERAAKPDEIVKLATFLGRKVHELVRPGEPVADLQPHLRAVAEKLKGDYEEQLVVAIADLQRLVEDYRQLEQIMNAPLRFNYPPEVPLNPKIDPSEFAESVATQERQRLGLGDQPIIYLRSTLEWDVGLRVFYGDLPSAIAGMYAFAADLGCCIFINKKHPPQRRRLSLAHEYGHVIIDRYKPGIDYLTIPGRKPANERFAEAFGLSFLMPASSLRQKFHDIVTSTGDFQVADLCRLSHFYFVSVEAMALRLEQLSLIPRGSWQAMKAADFAPLHAASLLELPSQPVDDFPYPQRYKYLAVHAFEQGKISQGQLANYLRSDPVTARGIVAESLTFSLVNDAGEQGTLNLEFQRSLLSDAS